MIYLKLKREIIFNKLFFTILQFPLLENHQSDCLLQKLRLFRAYWLLSNKELLLLKHILVASQPLIEWPRLKQEKTQLLES